MTPKIVEGCVVKSKEDVDWAFEFGGKGLDKPVQFTIHWNADDEAVAFFTLAPMPGCCGVVVSTASLNNKGRLPSAKFHAIKARVAHDLGYSAMIATCQTRNFPEVVGAAKNGWKFVSAWRNSRTDNDLALMFKELPK